MANARSLQAELSGASFGIASSASTAWQVSHTLRKAVDATLDYLWEKPHTTRATVTESLSELSAKHSPEDYATLSDYLSANPEEIRRDVAELATMVRDMKDPVPNLLLLELLPNIEGCTAAVFGQSWNKAKKAGPALISICATTLQGGTVEFLKIGFKIDDFCDYSRRLQRGTKDKCHRGMIAKHTNLVIGIANSLMNAAEARLPEFKFRPSTPARHIA